MMPLSSILSEFLIEWKNKKAIGIFIENMLAAAAKRAIADRPFWQGLL